MKIEKFLELLEARTGHRFEKSSNGYQACCPAHEDTNPSLSISESPEGNILVHCFAGCTMTAICEKVGIQPKELFHNSDAKKEQKKTEYPYQNAQGKVVYKKIRIEPGKNGKKKDFYFERIGENGQLIKSLKGIERVLYRLPEVLEAKKREQTIYFVEGEKDADRLRQGHLVATTTPEGADSHWYIQYTETLKNAHIALLYDEDDAGHKRRDAIYQELQGKAASIKVISLPGLSYSKNHGSDVSDWLNMGHSIQELAQLTEQMPAGQFQKVQIAETSSVLPDLIVPGGSQLIQETSRQLGQLLKKTGKFFIRGNTIVEIIHDNDEETILQPVDPIRMTSEIELVAQPVKVTTKGVVPTIFNKVDVERILKARNFKKELPEIKIMTKCPVFTIGSDGKLRTIIGYDPETGILSNTKALDDVGIEEAKRILLELLDDFHFVSDGDKSRAMAALLTPACLFGQAIKARSPLQVIEADQSQAGKGWLVKLIGTLYNQKIKTVTQSKHGPGGLEESLNKRLIEGHSLISLDNIRGKIDSPAIESLLTEDSYPARIPYMPPIDIETKRLMLLLTSNNAEMTVDLANRSCCIQIRKQPPNHKFKSFPEGDIIDHIQANHGKFFGAIRAVVSEWVTRGCQQTDENRHDFRKWARILDWIVQNIFELPPVMEKHRERQQRIVKKQLTWARSVGLLILKSDWANRWLRTSDILKLIEMSADDVEIPGLTDVESLADGATYQKVLRTMGRELGTCFSGAFKEYSEGGQVDVITIDEIKLERRIITERGESNSGSHDVKEYRFTLKNGSSSLTPPSFATVAAIPIASLDAQLFGTPQQIHQNELTELIESKRDKTHGGDGGGQWHDSGGPRKVEKDNDDFVEARI